MVCWLAIALGKIYLQYQAASNLLSQSYLTAVMKSAILVIIANVCFSYFVLSGKWMRKNSQDNIATGNGKPNI